MNTTIRRSLAVLVIAATCIPALIRAQAFEGVVTWEMSIPMLGDQKIPVTINLKGDKTMTTMDIPMQGTMKMYGDKAAKKMTMVQEAQKSGMEIDLAQSEAMMKNMPPSSVPKATGKKEKIKAYNAEEYSSTADGGIEVDMWISKDVPKEVAAGINASHESSMQMSGPKNEGFTELFKKGYAPLRTVVKKDGDVQMMMEFEKVEPKKLDDKLFVIASDITIQKNPPMNPAAGDDGSAAQQAPVTAPADTSKKGGMKMDQMKDGNK
jgi:hypothetical protein